MLKNGFIYVIRLRHYSEYVYKIGMTKSLEQRFRQLEKSYGAFKTIRTFPLINTCHAEDIIHKFFEDKNCGDVYYRELFDLSPDDLIVLDKLVEALQSFELRLGARWSA